MLLRGSKLHLDLTEIQGEKLNELFLKSMGVNVGKPPAVADIFKKFKKGNLGKNLEKVSQTKAALDFFREHIKADVTLIARVKKRVVTASIKIHGVKEVVDDILEDN